MKAFRQRRRQPATIGGLSHPPSPRREAAPTLLLLHGHGDRPDAFAEIGATLVAGTGWTLLCPPAPHRAGGHGDSADGHGDSDGGRGDSDDGHGDSDGGDVEDAGDGHGLAWWPDGEDGPSEGALSSLVALVARVAGEANAAPPLLLVGFSQGGAMALATAAALAGRSGVGALRVAVVAGFLPGDAAVPPAGTEVLVVHGEADDVVDPMHGELVARRCRRQGCSVEVVQHPGGHRWDDAVSAAVFRWLHR